MVYHLQDCGIPHLVPEFAGEMGQGKSQTLPIIPLPEHAVVLPGTTLRIPILGRPDLVSFLSTIYTRAKSPRPDVTGVLVGCVPLRSRLLSPDGKRLLDSNKQKSQEEDNDTEEELDYLDSDNLFACGTVARITGVQGRKADLALTVQGSTRFRIDKITQSQPFLEASVTYDRPDGKSLRLRWTVKHQG